MTESSVEPSGVEQPLAFIDYLDIMSPQRNTMYSAHMKELVERARVASNFSRARPTSRVDLPQVTEGGRVLLWPRRLGKTTLADDIASSISRQGSNVDAMRRGLAKMREEVAVLSANTDDELVAMIVNQLHQATSITNNFEISFFHNIEDGTYHILVNNQRVSGKSLAVLVHQLNKRLEKFKQIAETERAAAAKLKMQGKVDAYIAAHAEPGTTHICNVSVIFHNRENVDVPIYFTEKLSKRSPDGASALKAIATQAAYALYYLTQIAIREGDAAIIRTDVGTISGKSITDVDAIQKVMTELLSVKVGNRLKKRIVLVD